MNSIITINFNALIFAAYALAGGVQDAEEQQSYRYNGKNQSISNGAVASELDSLSKAFYHTCGWVGFDYVAGSGNTFALGFGEGGSGFLDNGSHAGEVIFNGSAYVIGGKTISREELVCRHMCSRSGGGLFNKDRKADQVVNCYANLSTDQAIDKLEEWMFGSPTQVVFGRQKSVSGWDTFLLLTNFSNKKLSAEQIQRLRELYQRPVTQAQDFYREVREYMDKNVFDLLK